MERAAYELFSRNGVRSIGVDTVISEANVAKMTLYRNFSSKDELILAFLRRRAELWTVGWLRAETVRRAVGPAERLLTVFALFDEWFRDSEFSGCPFITTMIEFADRAHPVRQASVVHLAQVRELLGEFADQAGIEHPEQFARQWHLLMDGAIIAAAEGDLDAALRARDLGVLLLRERGITV